MDKDGREVQIVTAYVPGALREETANAIHDAISRHPDVTWHQHELDPDNVHEYGLILRDYWDSGQSDLLVIEPDVVIGEHTLSGFLSCDHDYCGHPYALRSYIGVALGATRFRAEFMRKYPSAMARAVATNVSYLQLDVVLQSRILLEQHGEQIHGHLPVLEHLNPDKQLRPEADPTPELFVRSMFGNLAV